MNEIQRERNLGAAALWLAFAGLVVPQVIFFVIAFTCPAQYYDGQNWEHLEARCAIIAYVLEAAALACGVQASRTAKGRWGLAICNLVLALYLRA